VIRSGRSPAIGTGAILLVVIAVLYFARDILIPLAFAIILSLVLSPAVYSLQRLRIRRFPATLLVMFVSVSIACGAGYVISNQLLQVASDLPGYRQNIDNKIKALRTPGKGALGRAAQNVKDIGKELAAPADAPIEAVSRTRAGQIAASNPLAVRVVEAPGNELLYARDVAQPFLGPLAKLGIVLIFTVFLLVEETDLRNRIFRLAGLNRLNVMTQAVEDGTRRVSRYLVLQLLVNLGFGILCGIGLYAIGVPYAALWGAVAALLRIVPYVGSVAAGAMPLLLSLAVFDGWRAPLLVFALFATLELTTGNLLEPWLYGTHTGISSLALLLTTVFWAALWGPAGLILSTPLTVCVVVLGRHVPHLSFLHILLGDQPVLTPDAHLYQRLLAMDDQEARAVAEQYRHEHTLPELYDAVMIPALTLAEQDRHKGALDPDREEFLFQSLREMIADFSQQTETTQQPGTESPAPDQAQPEHPEETFALASGGRVFSLPAHDEADEIAAAMLAQLLEHAGCATIMLPLGSSFQTTLALIEPTRNDIFCISAVPPFAFSQARTLSRELRVKFPGVKVVIGIWGFGGETKRALLRFHPSPPDKFVRSLAEALEYLGVGATRLPAKGDSGASSAADESAVIAA
jgi:predicted PurR-regulated permease PerM